MAQRAPLSLKMQAMSLRSSSSVANRCVLNKRRAAPVAAAFAGRKNLAISCSAAEAEVAQGMLAVPCDHPFRPLLVTVPRPLPPVSGVVAVSQLAWRAV